MADEREPEGPDVGDDIARAMEAFLLGEDSAFMTGEALAINGGAFMD